MILGKTFITDLTNLAKQISKDWFKLLKKLNMDELDLNYEHSHIPGNYYK